MNEAEESLKRVGTVSKKFTIPMMFWDEWSEDCRGSFNNTYHLKMQFDHEFRKQFESTANLLMIDMVEIKQELFELKAELAELKSTSVEPSEPVKRKSFGGK
jgi:hypothetical protein